MMDNDRKESGIVIMIIVVVAFILGVSVGAGIAETHYRKQAIKNGHAQYNIETGDWEWKDKGVLKEDVSK